MLTDEQIAKLAEALEALPDRIQGFTSRDEKSHWVRDVYLDWDKQLLWRGDSHDEMMRQCRFHEMKLALSRIQESDQ